MKEKIKNSIFDDDYLTNAVSSGDCTGLIPANPYPETTENYEDVFRFMAHPTKSEPRENSPRIKATQK